MPNANVTTAAPGLVNRATELANYLSERPLTSAVPCLVTIGRTRYAAAFFAQIRKNSEGTPAYADGRRHYVHAGYSVLGTLPASYVRSRSTAYVTSDDRHAEYAERFYVGGYFGQGGEPANEWHPFGATFQLVEDTYGVTTDHETRPVGVEVIA